MREYGSFQDFFWDICEIKQYVIKLKGEDLREYKQKFYKQQFAMWRLDLMWEFIWDDIDYETMLYIFENAKII